MARPVHAFISFARNGVFSYRLTELAAVSLRNRFPYYPNFLQKKPQADLRGKFFFIALAFKPVLTAPNLKFCQGLSGYGCRTKSQKPAPQPPYVGSYNE